MCHGKVSKSTMLVTSAKQIYLLWPASFHLFEPTGHFSWMIEMEFLRYRSEDVRTALLFFPIVFVVVVVVGECKDSTQPSLVSRVF